MGYIVDEASELYYDKKLPKRVVEFAKFISSAPKRFDTRFLTHRRPRTVGIYYISEVWYCKRKWWYSFYDTTSRSVDNPDDVALIRWAESGNIHHDHVAKAIEYVINEDYDEAKMPMFVIPEQSYTFMVDLEQGIFLHGRVDNLVFFPEMSLLVEVKTRKSVENMKSPTQHHIPQFQLYLAAATAQYGLLLYEGRDNLVTRSFLIKRDNKEIHRLLKRVKSQHGLIAMKMLPPAESKLPLTRRAWECGRCKYKKQCDEAEKEKKKESKKK